MKKIFTNVTLVAFFIALFIGKINSQTISIPVSELSQTAKKYSFTYIISGTEKKEIRYICILSSSNEPKTCFDACDVCYPYDKGYTQKTNVLRCNNCGQTFVIDSLGKSQKKGTCNPSYLPNKVENGNVIIKESDLIEGAYHFKIMNYSGIEENHNHDFEIFTFNDYVNLKFTENADRNIMIYSINGNLIFDTKVNSNYAFIKPEIFTAGVYVISVNCDNKQVDKLFYFPGK